MHASQFFFHLDVEKPWEFDMLFRLNKTLPPDIAVFDILPMEGLPHARFDAIQRSYDYFIHTYKDPFLSNGSSLYLINNLNLDKMKEATALLPHYSDYRYLCATPDDHDSTTCDVTSARLLTDKQGGRLRFQISANRFLRKMIRVIIGKLILIGTGELSVEEFESYLTVERGPKELSPAHPQGLYLSKVTYPYLDLPPRSTFSPLLQNQTNDYWQAV